MKRYLLQIASLLLAAADARGGTIQNADPSPLLNIDPYSTLTETEPPSGLDAQTAVPPELLVFTDAPAVRPEWPAAPPRDAPVTSTPDPPTVSLIILGSAIALAAFALRRLRRT